MGLAKEKSHKWELKYFDCFFTKLELHILAKEKSHKWELKGG